MSESASYRASDGGTWRYDTGERDAWDETHDYRDGHRETDQEDTNDSGSTSVLNAVPAAVAVAIGVQVGRWWALRRVNLTGAVGAGMLATALGFAGGPAARAVLAVLAATSDMLAASAALARPEPA